MLCCVEMPSLGRLGAAGPRRGMHGASVQAFETNPPPLQRGNRQPRRRAPGPCRRNEQEQASTRRCMVKGGCDEGVIGGIPPPAAASGLRNEGYFYPHPHLLKPSASVLPSFPPPGTPLARTCTYHDATGVRSHSLEKALILPLNSVNCAFALSVTRVNSVALGRHSTFKISNRSFSSSITSRLLDQVHGPRLACYRAMHAGGIRRCRGLRYC